MDSRSGVRRKFSWRVSFSGIWWSFVFGLRSLWRHNLTSYSCFQIHVLAKFLDITGIFFYTHFPYFMCHCTQSKLSAFQVRIAEENKTQRYDTAVHNYKNIRQHVKTREWNTLITASEQFQLQNETALMSCRIRAVDHRKCAAGLAGAHPNVKRNIWPIIVHQSFCFSEQRNKVWRLLFWCVLCKIKLFG